MICSVIFRGRENAHVDEGFKLVQRLVAELAEIAKVEQEPHDARPADRASSWPRSSPWQVIPRACSRESLEGSAKESARRFPDKSRGFSPLPILLECGASEFATDPRGSDFRP